MRKFFALVLIFSTIISVFSTCKKDKTYRSNGYIKGTITGKNIDAVRFDDSFTYEKYYDDTDGSYVVGDGYKQFSICRIDPDVQGSARISFVLMNSGAVVDGAFTLDYLKTASTYYSYYLVDCFASSDTGGSITLSSVSFDETSKLLKGSYTATIPQYSTSDSITYTSTVTGSFSVNVKQESN